MSNTQRIVMETCSWYPPVEWTIPLGLPVVPEV